MLKRFADDDSQPVRAVQAWHILIAKAHHRQTLTLGAMAQLLHLPDPGAVVFILGHIMLLCREHQLPPLTLLVINEKTGLGMTVGRGTADPNLDREAVYNYDWYAYWPPTSEDLRLAYARG
ncbi:MAG: hypothetical protein ABI847_10505 [Anaerolineales bacterium]